MSQFNPKKLNIEAIHAGQRYPDTRSAFLPSDVNEIIESLYGISLGVENSAKRAFILSTPGNLIDISAVNKNIYFPKGTTIYTDGYSDVFSEDKYVAFDYFVKLLRKGIVVYNKKTKTISIETDGFNSGSTYQDLYLFAFAYDDENNLVTDLPVEHLVNGEKQSYDRTIVKEPYSTSFAYINIDTKSYEISIPEGTGFGDIAFNWDETYSYAENVYNEPGLYEIAIVYDRTEELIKSMFLYELYEHRNYAWLFTIRMDADKFVYCDLEAPFYVDGVLFDGGAATLNFVKINEDGSVSVGAPTSGESAINAYALKRHLSRHSKLYPSKEENGVTVYNKLKFVMPADDKYFAMVGDHSAETGGINPKVSFDTTRPVYIPSVVPTAQYEGYGYSPVPVDLPVNSIRIGAFQQNRTVRSVVIQEGVARIEANAFDGCKQLTSIVLADTIKMIDNNAFNNVGTEVSSAKIPVKLPKALEYICQQAFNNVKVCGSIVFPNRCLYIGGIPNNLTSGAGRVFTSPYITQIVFEGTPKYIHGDAFGDCTCDIYVPWNEGEVAGAPWGTTGTVHYNSYPNAFPNIDIVQTTGESTTAVMSQKAVHDMWDGMETKIGAIAEDVSTIWSDQGWQNERHDELTARVEALEEGGGGSSVEIVQSTGTSTEAVMSQDATTKQLNNKVTVGSADMQYPVLYGRTPSGYYGGGAQKMYKISDTNYAPSSSSGDGALVKWYGYGTSGQIINQNAPQSAYDLSNKKYVDARSGYMTTVYWSNVQGSEYIVVDRGTAYNYPSNIIPNSEYCIAFCNRDGSFDNSLDPTSGQLRFKGTFDEVLLRGEGNKDCIEISGNEVGHYSNGVIIKFTDTDKDLRGTYKILKFRELPCPTGAVVLIIEVIY